MADSAIELLFKIRSDPSQAVAGIKEFRAAYATELGQVKNLTDTLGTGALKGLNLEIINLARNVPVIGQPLAGATQSILAAATASETASKTAKALTVDYAKLTSLLPSLQKSFDKAPFSELETTLNRLGVKFKSGGVVGNAGVEDVAQIAKAFREIPDPVDRAAVAYEVFGVKSAAAIPILEKFGAQTAANEAQLTGAATAATSTGASFGALALGVGAAAVVIAAAGIAAFALAERAAKAGDEIYKASLKTSISTETLSALRITADDAGVSFGSISTALTRFEKNLGAAADGNKKLGATFREMGIDAAAGLKNPDAAFEKFLKYFQSLPLDGSRAAAAIKVFGRAGAEMIPLLDELGSSLKGAKDEAAAMGTSFSKDAAKQAHDFQVALHDVGDATEGLVVQFGSGLLPALKSVITDFTSAEQGGKSFAATLGKNIGDATTEAIGKLKSLNDSLNDISAFFANPNLSTLSTAFSGREVALNAVKPIAVDELTPKIPTTSKEEVDAVSSKQADLEKARAAARESDARTTREFNQNSISRQTATEREIATAKKLRDASIEAIQAERDAKAQELAAIVDTDEKAKKERDSLNSALIKLDADAEKAKSNFRIAAENKRSELLVEQRKLEVDHEKARLNNLLEIGKTEIALTERRIKDGTVAREAGIKHIEELENAGFKARLFVNDKEQAAAGANVTELQRLKDERTGIEREQTASLQTQSERRADIRKHEAEEARDAQNEALRDLESGLSLGLRLRRVHDSEIIEATREAVRLRTTSAEAGARRLAEIQDAETKAEIDALNARKRINEQRLNVAGSIEDPEKRKAAQRQIVGEEKKLADDLKILVAQRSVDANNAGIEIEAGRQDDLRRAREYSAELRRLDTDINKGALDAGRVAIDILVRHGASRRRILQAEHDQNAKEEIERHRAIKVELAAEQLRALNLATTAAERLAIKKRFDKLEEQENKRHETADQQNDEQKSRGTSAFGGIKDELDKIPDLSAHQFGVDALTGSFVALKTSILESVDAFVFSSGTIGQVLRKNFAELAASLAKEAALQALKQGALALASLAVGDFGGAAKHTLAATGWLALAGAAAIGGRAIAGNPNASAGAGGAFASGGTGGNNAPAYAPFNYGGSTFSASQANAQGSRSLLGAIQENTQATVALHNRIGSIPQDHIITNNPNAVADAFLTASDSSHRVNTEFAKNARLG
ncbi:MAG: hypothetical protein ACR2LC_09710 [Pyrinomonadaceae bacterium]